MNTEAAPLSVRRGEQERHTKNKKGDEDKPSDVQKNVTVIHTHRFVADKNELSVLQRIEKMLDMLSKGELESDEETGFSVSKDKKRLIAKKYSLLKGNL